MRPYEKLHETWQRIGYDLHAGRERDLHTPVEDCNRPFPDVSLIEQIERSFDLVLPADFRDHLLHLPLTVYGIEDDEMVLFWSADTVLERNSAGEVWKWLGDRSLCFCDHMVSCVEWAIQCEPGPDYGKVATSYAEMGYLYDSFADCVGAYAGGSLDFSFAAYPPRKPT